MAQMFNDALQRMALGQHGQIVPVASTKKPKEGEEELAREIIGYEMQWMEGNGVDPTDTILCRYRVKDERDVARITAAQVRKQTIEQMAKDRKN
jgi:hypothetical protein